MKYQDLAQAQIIPSQIVPLVEKAGQNNVPVYIQGEQGVGKEWIAKMIHQLGEWKYHRFYKIDCRMLKEGTLLQQFSPLFKEIRYGAIPTTLFLKEVGCLGLGDQLKLLELLEGGFFLFEDEKRSLQGLRWISSSSDPLRERVAQGKFSEDLYDQLNALFIQIPPLRERNKDIPAIAQYLLTEYADRMHLKKKGISQSVLSLLQSYWWPGNLKELEMVILRSAIFSEGGRVMEKDLFFETGHEGDSFVDFLKKSEPSPARTEKGIFPADQNGSPLPLFFIELVHRIKNPLVSVKTFTQMLREKFSDPEFRDTFYRIVTDDIEKIDRVLNDLLNYIKVNTPLSKTNTVNLILEEVLQGLEPQLDTRKVKVFKKLEKDLPETIVHEEHLKYILNSILQFAVPSIPLNGSIGFMTKSFIPEGEQTRAIEKDGKYIEILIIFTGYKKSVESFETLLGIPGVPTGDPIELELRLAKEMIQKNQGLMKLEVNEMKPRTLISLRFPVERRKTVYYPSTV